MVIVTKSKWCQNSLCYDKKTKEYVYMHRNEEIWRTPSVNGDLLAYFIKCKSNDRCIDDHEINELVESKIFKKYTDSCLASC